MISQGKNHQPPTSKMPSHMIALPLQLTYIQGLITI